MVYRVEHSLQSKLDLAAIIDFLIDSHAVFGADAETAFTRAENTARALDLALTNLGRNPYRGALTPEMGAGVRRVTFDRAVVYFEIDETSQSVRVMALFYGGQDHEAHMRRRLAGPEP